MTTPILNKSSILSDAKLVVSAHPRVTYQVASAISDKMSQQAPSDRPATHPSIKGLHYDCLELMLQSAFGISAEYGRQVMNFVVTSSQAAAGSQLSCNKFIGKIDQLKLAVMCATEYRDAEAALNLMRSIFSPPKNSAAAGRSQLTGAVFEVGAAGEAVKDQVESFLKLHDKQLLAKMKIMQLQTLSAGGHATLLRNQFSTVSGKAMLKDAIEAAAEADQQQSSVSSAMQTIVKLVMKAYEKPVSALVAARHGHSPYSHTAPTAAELAVHANGPVVQKVNEIAAAMSSLLEIGSMLKGDDAHALSQQLSKAADSIPDSVFKDSLVNIVPAGAGAPCRTNHMSWQSYCKRCKTSQSSILYSCAILISFAMTLQKLHPKDQITQMRAATTALEQQTGGPPSYQPAVVKRHTVLLLSQLYSQVSVPNGIKPLPTFVG